ncbi:MAG: hypothetical protein JW891_16315 [Candidatus Lokiarchaeota archaeon]|nr:hypothetical protein [Candidatus Lokiarchaeota archaeon]
MALEFRNPPTAILASGSKNGVDLGGQKCIISIDRNHNLYNEGYISTEMSWGEFYREEGIKDQIDSFTTVEYRTVQEDPEELSNTLVKSFENIIKNQRLFYGIADFEVDAFMNENCVIPDLKLDYKVINKLLDAHRKSREENLFPKIISDTHGRKSIRVEFQGANKKNLHFIASKIENYSDLLRTASGFATGIVCTSKGAANFYILTDNIVFKEGTIAKMYIDQENIDVIMMAIQREVLFPISWFRIDIGLKSLENFEKWNDIKDNTLLKSALTQYEKYITVLIYKKYKEIASNESIGLSSDNDFYNMTVPQRNKALRDMADAIRKLTELYKE